MKKQARNLGVAFGHDNLVKFWGFTGSHRPSYDASCVKNVDRGRIEAWRKLVEEKDDPPEQLKNGNTEEWESKSVEIYDSVTAVAEGKERERIEKWWTMCEM